jgi:hypothetical protein
MRKLLKRNPAPAAEKAAECSAIFVETSGTKRM